MDLYLQTLAVAGVIGLLLFATRLMRRGTLGPFTRGGPTKILEAKERLPISPQLSVHVIRIGQRHMAIAAHSSGITILDSWGDPAQARPDFKIHLADIANREAPSGSSA
jgi:flagellar biogenesis protein FliO